ncbi:MAG: Gx transporter family protein [Oscillospiraceae bacterium]
MNRRNSPASKVAFAGLLLAMTLLFSWLEGLIPPLPGLSGVRLGLANVVVMYAFFSVGKGTALLLVLLKAGFAVLTRNPIAAALSLTGGLISLLVIFLLWTLSRGRMSYLLISVFGAIAHNMGQLAMASLLMKTNLVFYTLPVLLVAGVVMGAVTGLLLRVVLPLFDRVRGEIKTGDPDKL